MKKFWFDFKVETTMPTKYRSVEDDYCDFEAKGPKAVYKKTRFLEYQYTTHTLLRLFGINFINKTKYYWARVKKPNCHLVWCNIIDIRGENAKSTESFWFDVSVKKDPILTTNNTFLYINEEIDGDLTAFLNKWPDHNKYMDEYYWPEIRRVAKENNWPPESAKKAKETIPKVVNLN